LDGLWTLSNGLSQFHGHGSWLVCEVALNIAFHKATSLLHRALTTYILTNNLISFLYLLGNCKVSHQPTTT
jgi:hypothetical protein